MHRSGRFVGSVGLFVLTTTLVAGDALSPQAPQAQQAATGRLQLHFLDVGQGDAALLISPNGETVLFDSGVFQGCEKPIAYLQALGVTAIDYSIASHYHSDHIGCVAALQRDTPLVHEAYDRGGSYSGDVYKAYVHAIGSKRKPAGEETTITLDRGTDAPVTVRLVAANGNGVDSASEDDQSVVAVVTFGQFKAVLGGDLTGFAENDYRDIETSVAPKVGRVDVYKVHGHGGRSSSNAAWLTAVQPRVAVISAGTGNHFGDPAPECLDRLHRAGVKTYWTEVGNGAAPEPGLDVVGGNILIEVQPGAGKFTVRTSTRPPHADEYTVWAASGASAGPGPAATYSWSRRAGVYHYSSCSFVRNISPDQLDTGSEAPAGKTLHQGCPR